MDPPAGIALADNQHYNPYFPGGAIGMAQALYDEVITFLFKIFSFYYLFSYSFFINNQYFV